MAPTDATPSGVDALNTLVDNSLAIVQKLQAYTNQQFKASHKKCKAGQNADLESLSGDNWDPPTHLNALNLAHDAATLIRAHATKISLLMTNEPFTPSAIGKVVQELMAGPVPALSNAVQECHGDRYTFCIRRELSLHCQSLLKLVCQLLNSIPRDGNVLKTKVSGEGKTNSPAKTDGVSSSRGAFTAIGILWSECDSLKGMGTAGVSGCLIRMVEQVSDTLKDEMQELKEWGDEVDEEDEDEDEEEDEEAGSHNGHDDNQTGNADNGNEDSHASMQELLDDLVNSSGHIPAADPDHLRPRLETALKKIRMVQLLCKAIIKRRLRELPPMPTEMPSSIAAQLDNTINVLQGLVEQFGDLAAAFYDLEADAVDLQMEECLRSAFIASELLVLSWDKKQDLFSDWATRFQTELRISNP